MLLRIVAPHFVAGIDVYARGKRNAAPIIAYMTDWPEHRIRAYCARRGWKVEIVVAARKGEGSHG